LGGPGSSGVIVFNKALYQNAVPDHPGGGTVTWTNPWGEHHYFNDIEVREDGGTPGFLQGIKASLAVLLKDEMKVDKIMEREEQLKHLLMNRLEKIPEITILEAQHKNRICFVSFYVEGLHHNLIVRVLNDRFGIQTRGGCSCAGTYGHVLLKIDYHESHRITSMIDVGDLSEKPGWVRISLHPSMTNQEVNFIVDALEEIIREHQRYKADYNFDPHSGDFSPKSSSLFNIDIHKIFQS
jgi:selenocysteine lyase/cysteine desulfurase